MSDKSAFRHWRLLCRSQHLCCSGHGQSDKPEVAYTQERFARAVQAVMRDAGIERAVLVGHSMGGPVGLTFVRLFPAKAKALVLVDAFVPQAPKDEAARERQKVCSRWSRLSLPVMASMG